MLGVERVGLLLGAVALGAVHGVEPGHGWPVAATYALDRSHTWLAGLTAGTVIGLGHLVSSLAVVGVFFAAKSYFSLARLNDPVAVGSLTVGSPIGIVAGVLLIALGVREYRGEHSHSHGSGHDHDDHHTHDHGDHDTDAFEGKGLLGIAWVAFVLGFAHEEEFEIIALCAGSDRCLELMTAYALTVVVAIVALTLALVAGYQHFEERVEAYAHHLPTVSAAVLVLMGVGFLTGVL